MSKLDEIKISERKEWSGDYRSPTIRTEWIHLENDTIGDGLFSFEVAKTLRQYADMIDRGEAGNRAVETFVSSGGTRLFAIGATWNRCKATKGSTVTKDEEGIEIE